MIGYITSQEKAQEVLDAIHNAFVTRDVPACWTTGAMPIYSGEHTGKMFIPADDAILNTPLYLYPHLQCPKDFPEFEQIIASLGGLEARINIDSSDLINHTLGDT
jgi:hypothetical protein